MSRFCSLCSSSRGNSLYIGGGDEGILIDAGIGFRAINSALASQGLSTSSLRGVLITHEHSDHIKGLPSLLRNLNLPVYASAGTLEYLCMHGYIPPGSTLVEFGCKQAIGGGEVTSFSISHDAADPVGFRFSLPDGRTASIATDLGAVTEQVRAAITGSDLVVLESNYDPGMLDFSSYPYHLKRRIKSSLGHLSNEECAKELTRLALSGTTRMILAHLSEQNNLPALAYQSATQALGAASLKENLDYIIKIAPPKSPMGVIAF